MYRHLARKSYLLWQLLKSLPGQLLLSICSAFMFSKFFDLSTIRFFFTISTCLVESLLFILPFMVFTFVFRALLAIDGASRKFVLLILAGVTLSNCIALTTSFLLAETILPWLGIQYSSDFADKFSSNIQPFLSLNLPVLIKTDKALLLGFSLGLGLGFLKLGNPIRNKCERLARSFGHLITVFLRNFFIPLVPLYVFGFCLKLAYEQALAHLLSHYSVAFLVTLCLIIGYVFAFYWVASGCSLKNTIKNLRIMFPAGLTGFSTMSSAATMPVTLICVEETTQDRNFTNLVIPSTVNIHMLGDNLSIIMASVTLLGIFGVPHPSVGQFCIFVAAYCFAKLSCVGLPGASVLVILPVLQQHLGFTPEMVSIITTIYILQDPFCTAANVMGNGALALSLKKFFHQPSQTAESLKTVAQGD
ncbi:MAG: cation:dicarboxylase symporter family transporter [Oligoflexales bacterium]|nr:cation:dicarboxylase symporter family transporter [Oligoflexales bacterium]